MSLVLLSAQTICILSLFSASFLCSLCPKTTRATNSFKNKKSVHNQIIWSQQDKSSIQIQTWKYKHQNTTFFLIWDCMSETPLPRHALCLLLKFSEKLHNKSKNFKYVKYFSTIAIQFAYPQPHIMRDIRLNILMHTKANQIKSALCNDPTEFHHLSPQSAEVIHEYWWLISGRQMVPVQILIWFLSLKNKISIQRLTGT